MRSRAEPRASTVHSRAEPRASTAPTQARASLASGGRWCARFLTHALLALIAAPGAALPTPDQVRALETKIGDTPAQSIDLKAAARAPASAPLPTPALAPGSVVPGASKFKNNEARYIALFPSDEQNLSDFVRAERQLPDGAQLFKGALRALAGDDQVITLKALAFARGPLRFNAKKDQFEGPLSVGVVAVSEGATPKLAAPIPFRVTGDVSSVPGTLLVDHVGPPYAEIVVATHALSAPMEVRVVSAASPEPVGVTVSSLPALRLVARPASILGLGLQSADLTFEIVGPRQGGKADVQLSSSLGTLSETSFRFLAGHARAELRSQRVGAASVMATAPGLEPVKLEIEFAFPWLLLAAGVIGGLAGAFIQRGFLLGRNEALASILLGGLSVLLYVWAMAEAPLELPVPVGELLMFVLATLGAYHGLRLYTYLTEDARARRAS
jgi:hypothetical protein